MHCTYVCPHAVQACTGGIRRTVHCTPYAQTVCVRRARTTRTRMYHISGLCGMLWGWWRNGAIYTKDISSAHRIMHAYPRYAGHTECLLYVHMCTCNMLFIHVDYGTLPWVSNHIRHVYERCYVAYLCVRSRRWYAGRNRAYIPCTDPVHHASGPHLLGALLRVIS